MFLLATRALSKAVSWTKAMVAHKGTSMLAMCKLGYVLSMDRAANARQEMSLPCQSCAGATRIRSSRDVTRISTRYINAPYVEARKCEKYSFANGLQKPNGHGSCRNSNRGKAGIATPAQFFSPCHFPGGAYAFDADNRANNLNQRCPKEQYTCCIGSECPNNPAQH